MAVIANDSELVRDVLDRLDAPTAFHFPGVKIIEPPHQVGTRLVTQAEKELVHAFSLPLNKLIPVDELPIMHDRNKFLKKNLPPAEDLLNAWEARRVHGPQVQFHQDQSTVTDEASVGDVWKAIGATIAALFETTGALEGLPQLHPEGRSLYPLHLNPLYDVRSTGLHPTEWGLGTVYTAPSTSGLTRTDIACKYYILDVLGSQVFYLVVELKGPYKWWSRAGDIKKLIEKGTFDINTHLTDTDHAAHFIIQVSTPTITWFFPVTD